MRAIATVTWLLFLIYAVVSSGVTEESDNFYYRFSQGFSNQQQASDYCKTEFGTALATINTDELQTEVDDFFTNVHGASYALWIGLKGTTVANGGYMWVDEDNQISIDLDPATTAWRLNAWESDVTVDRSGNCVTYYPPSQGNWHGWAMWGCNRGDYPHVICNKPVVPEPICTSATSCSFIAGIEERLSTLESASSVPVVVPNLIFDGISKDTIIMVLLLMNILFMAIILCVCSQSRIFTTKTVKYSKVHVTSDMDSELEAM